MGGTRTGPTEEERERPGAVDADPSGAGMPPAERDDEEPVAPRTPRR